MAFAIVSLWRVLAREDLQGNLLPTYHSVSLLFAVRHLTLSHGDRIEADLEPYHLPTDTCIGVWAREHRWTLSRHLWEAADSFEFFRAWREKPSFVISSFDFAGFLETGKPQDVDDFARILMTL